LRLQSRILTALFGLAVVALCAALTLSLFPRTLVGVLLLLGVGIPVALLAEGLWEVAASKGTGARYIGGVALIGFIALLLCLWWWWSIHSAFMHRHFVGQIAPEAPAHGDTSPSNNRWRGP
jgi:hypothetical protein